MGFKRYHKGCGGEIVNRKCLKCGKKFSLVGYYTTNEIADKDTSKFDPKAYRKRIRNGNDIP